MQQPSYIPNNLDRRIAHLYFEAELSGSRCIFFSVFFCLMYPV